MFQQVDLQGSLSSLANGIDYAGMVIFCIPSMIFVDKVGCVKLMVIESIGMCVCFFIMADLHVVNMSANNPAEHAVVVFIFIFVAFYATTWAPVASIYIAEIFLSKGLALASAILWVYSILVGQAPILMDKITVLLVSLCWLGYLFAPEPRNLSLEEMEVVFHGPLIVANLNYDEYIKAHH
ncbi:hypothetical protein [Parasitella parasitica]|uniref:Major facilitator superfamily (MFS) profile domain-containing protein n=1 Tax=Parasitella parasitica TaxID=35722 RepID=A0A0B7MX23_9FUNG|nr:hypothetical protein [Parasitella parasitica]